MITIKELESAGYKQYPAKSKDNCYGLWQKIIFTPENKKAYFINFYCYELPGFCAFSIEVSLYRCENGKEYTFDLNLRQEEWMTVETVEQFYEQTYKDLNCCPDLHNND